MEGKKNLGFTVIEFCIVLMAFLIVLAATIPIMEHRIKAQDKSKILSNMRLLKVHAEAFFTQHETGAIRFYDLVGLDKPIYKFEYVQNETYPEVIYRNEPISVQTQSFGRLTID